MKEQTMLERARDFAIQAHGDQKYGDAPYRNHLYHVEQVVKRHNYGDFLEAAAWLHDVLEDTKVTYEELKREFGQEMADVVYSVTDEPGENRKARKAATYVKTKNNYHGVKLKLCDRIANVEACVRDERKDLFKMYLKEHEDFMCGLGLRRDYVIFSKRLLRDELDRLMESSAKHFDL